MRSPAFLMNAEFRGASICLVKTVKENIEAYFLAGLSD